mgnify:CR=1 FL=1
MLIAGIDIGNSTTEIVVSQGSQPIAWDRRPTRGSKGSAASVQSAAALLKSIERTNNISVDAVSIAPWKPVSTTTSTISEPKPFTGVLQIISCSQHSVTGNGAVSGRPWVVDQPLPAGKVIAVVPDHIHFEDAARLISACNQVVGAIAARDEAILISHRIQHAIPIVDCADTDLAQQALKLFIEVRPAGNSVVSVNDVWVVSHELGLDESQHKNISLLASWLKQDRAAVLAVMKEAPKEITFETNDFVCWANGVTEPTFHAVDRMNENHVGAIRQHNEFLIDDLWALDLGKTLSMLGLKVSASSHSRTVVTAELASSPAPHVESENYFQAPVTICESEAVAAAIGAQTTPGITKDAIIVDIGGGTIDRIASATPVSVAGAGEMLTSAVAHYLNIPLGAADWIKRLPAARVESPQILLNEDGTRTFTDNMNVTSFLGKLVTPGPSGLMSFGPNLQVAEWRLIRQLLKANVIAANIERLISDFDNANVVLVGGPAADDELLPLVSALPNVRAVGRGNVAGQLGQRYCVAYGLTQIAN